MKKSRKYRPVLSKIRWRKICMMMKLTLFMCVFFVFASYAGVLSQQKVNMKLGETTIKEALMEFQRLTHAVVLYSDDNFATTRKVVANFKDVAIDQFLNILLKGSGMTYKLEGNYILIVPARALVADSVKSIKEYVIGGVVKDSRGEVIPGVTIIVKGTAIGTATDQYGKYRLKIPEIKNLSLLFSFIGMETQEVKYKGRDTINVVMEESTEQLEEVVVNTGYGTVNRRHLTSAVTSLKADDIKVAGMNTVDQMLEGHVPGMIFMQNSGQVGAAPKLRIRGTSTVLGNQEPVWVLDGMILSDPVNLSASQINDLDFVNLLGNAISGLNPDDIEQIDVLKDAAATAIYGPKAANGVIVVTTKKGRVGKPSISYSFSSGFRRRPRYTNRGVNVMNSSERLEFSKELFENHIAYPQISSWVGYEGALKDYYDNRIDYAELEKRVNYYETINTDWFDVIFRDAFSHNHTLSISGGTDNIRYYTSFGMNDECGTLRGESNKRYTTNMNLSMTYKNFSMRVGINGNVQKRSYTPSEIGLSDYAYNTSRAVPTENENGSLWYYDRSKSGFLYPFNVLNERDNSSNDIEGNTMNVQASLEYKFFSNWRASLLMGYNVSNTNQQTWYGANTWYVGTMGFINPETGAVDDEYAGRSLCPIGGELTESDTRNEGYSARFELNYNKYLDDKQDHHVTASAFWELSSSKYLGMDKTMRGYMKDRGLLISAVDYKKYPSFTQWRTESQEALGKRSHSLNNKVAGILTFTYSYKLNYIFNANIRFDASNKFGNKSNSQILPIWSLSGRWNIKDDLLKDFNWVHDIALRASFGYQGNMLDDQSPKLVIRKGGVHTFYNELTSTIERFPNPNLRWEKTKTLNVELDFSFFKGKVYGSLGAYYRKTTDAYMSKTISPVNGVRTYTVNTGVLENSGFECLFSFQPFNNLDFSQSGKIGGFSWRIDPQIGSVFNQLVDKVKKKDKVLQDEDEIDYNHYLNGMVALEGYAINSFFSYKFKGLDPQDGRPMFYDIEPEKEAVYKDMMKQELFLSVMEHSGCRQPFLQGGVSSTMQWRRVVLSFNLTYSFGGKTRLLKLYPDLKENNGTIAPQPERNVRREYVHRWRRAGDEAKTNIPGIVSNKVYKETLTPWWQDSAEMAYKFSANIWQMYDNSNLRVVSSSHVKLQSLSIRYIVPEAFCKKIGLKSVYLSASGSNLFTIASKKLKGQDPSQSGSSSSIAVPIPAMYNFSFNMTF